MYLLETIPRISISDLTNHGACALILHARLHEINWVDDGGASS